MTRETKTIDDTTYEVAELTLGDVEDLLGKDGVNFSVEIFKRAVFKNGIAIGEEAKAIPMRHYGALQKIVTRLNTNTETEGNQ